MPDAMNQQLFSEDESVRPSVQKVLEEIVMTSDNDSITESDFIVEFCQVHHGMKDENPVDKV